MPTTLGAAVRGAWYAKTYGQHNLVEGCVFFVPNNLGGVVASLGDPQKGTLRTGRAQLLEVVLWAFGFFAWRIERIELTGTVLCVFGQGPKRLGFRFQAL